LRSSKGYDTLFSPLIQ